MKKRDVAREKVDSFEDVHISTDKTGFSPRPQWLKTKWKKN